MEGGKVVCRSVGTDHEEACNKLRKLKARESVRLPLR
jgi:hypothetical protein